MSIGIGYFLVNLALPIPIPILTKKADTTDTDTIGTSLVKIPLFSQYFVQKKIMRFNS